MSSTAHRVGIKGVDVLDILPLTVPSKTVPVFLYLLKTVCSQVGLTLPDEPKIEGKKLKAVKEMKPAGWHPRYD